LEFPEADGFPLVKSPPSQTENILFSVDIPEDQLKSREEIQDPAEEEKLYVHSKLEFIATQLPLHSISEDANSPYFASSPSNITAYVRGPSVSYKAKSDIDLERKFSSPTEYIDESNSGGKDDRGDVVRTTTSISENYIENANLNTLEMKLDKIMKKRTKRIQIFETYLNEWEKEKFDKGKENKSLKIDPKPSVKDNKIPLKQGKKENRSRMRNRGLKVAKTIKVPPKKIASLYCSQGSKQSGIKNFDILSPVLKSAHYVTKHK